MKTRLFKKFSKTWPWVVISTIIYLRIPPILGGDTGQWLEIGNQLSRGKDLYSEISELKDPAFYHLIQLLYPFLQFWTLPILYFASWMLIGAALSINAKSKPSDSPTGMILIVACLYSAFGTKDAIPTLIGTVVLTYSIMLLERRRLSGLVLLISVPFFKILFSIFIPIFIFRYKSNIIVALQKNLYQTFLTLSVFFGGIYLFRQEIKLWFSILFVNVQYAQDSPMQIKNSTSHLQILFHQLLTETFVLISISVYLCSIFFLVSSRNNFSKQAILTTAAVNIASISILAVMYLWPHHTANLIFATTYNFSQILRRQLKSVACFKKSDTRILLIIFMLLASLVAVNPPQLTKLSINFAYTGKDFFNIQPFPDEWTSQFSLNAKYAYLGRSEIGPFPGSFLSKSTDLVCKDTAIWPFLQKSADEQFKCAKNAQLIFISEYVFDSREFSEQLNLLFGTTDPESNESKYLRINGTWYDWQLYQVRRN